jgi:hypothetical protein
VSTVNNWKAVDEVMEKSESTGASRLVLVSIARHINRRTRVAWPGTDQLAYLANCHEDHVRKCLRSLEALGELEVEIQGGPGTSKADKPNLYRIPFLTRGVNLPAEDRDISDGEDESTREGPTATGDTYPKTISSTGELPPHPACNPTTIASLKQSGVHALVPEQVREVLFRNLPPSSPEIELLRKILVERTGRTPPPEFDPTITRAEAVARLKAMLATGDGDAKRR